MKNILRFGFVFGCGLAIINCSSADSPRVSTGGGSGAAGEHSAGAGTSGNAGEPAGEAGVPNADGSSTSEAGTSNGGAAGATESGAGGAGDPTSGGKGSTTGACNALSLPPVVAISASAGAPPVLTGGAIADGLYFVTSLVHYGPTRAGNITVQEAYRFEGGQIETAISSSERPKILYAGTFSTSGRTLTQNVTCPTQGVILEPYSVTANGITLQHGTDANEIAYLVKQ